MENAVTFLKQETAAVELAEQEGYAPTAEDLRKIGERAAARAGYGGLNTDAWRFVFRRQAALDYVYGVYLERYGNDQGASRRFDGGESYLTAAISGAAQTMDVTNHLTGLNAAAVTSRFSASPYGTRLILSRPMLVGSIPASGVSV